MSGIESSVDEALVQRLPLPLAQLYRRAHNARTPLERHLTAFYLWEAGLKLLASVAIVEYAQRGAADPGLTERLRNLARPALGHWWEFVRCLVPVLAEQGDNSFRPVRDLLLGRPRDDFPRTAGLDAALCEALQGKSGARATVRFADLFDRLVQYRNTVLAHAAPGQLKNDFNERMAQALLAGLAEILGRIDLLAGRRLLYVAEVRQVAGNWLVRRSELVGATARTLADLELPRGEAARLPDAERLYLDGPGPATGLDVPCCLHPLLLYDADAEEVLFLNSRRGRKRTEYLCYTTGRTTERADLGGEQRALLARVLGMEVAEGQAEQWAAQSQAGEGPAEPVGQEPARQLGEFELLSRLGEGGMGVVYRAWQPGLGRQVALKCLSHSGARAEARFTREVRALGKVEHPHLVKVYTSGSDGDRWFYVMELVEGATLATVCETLQERTGDVTAVDARTWWETFSTACEETRKAEEVLADPATTAALPRLPPERPPLPVIGGPTSAHQVVELVRQVAEAAHALHEAGVVHRDIKPGNIIVRAQDGQAILVDLGLAQLTDLVQGKVTRTREFVGTLRYASPEQVLAVERVDRRSDVYSLGATLWELLTLHPLYGATEETPPFEVMKRIQYSKPDRVGKHHPGIGPDLEAIVSKCLEKEAGSRYATARELAEDLVRWQRGEPVRARRLTPSFRLGEWLRPIRLFARIPFVFLALSFRLSEWLRRNRTRIGVGLLVFSAIGLLIWLTGHSGDKDQTVHREETVAVHREETVTVEVDGQAVREAVGQRDQRGFLRWVGWSGGLRSGAKVVLRPDLAAGRPVRLWMEIEVRGGPLPERAEAAFTVNGVLQPRRLELRQWGEEPVLTAADRDKLPAFLLEGRNEIAVVVTHDHPGSLEATVRLTWEFDSSYRPRLHLLTVGIGDYAEPYEPLTWPARDAAALAEAFRIQAGAGKLFRDVRPAVGSDSGVLLNPGRQVFYAALKDIQKAAVEGDLVVVSVSSHGDFQANDCRILFKNDWLSWADFHGVLADIQCPVIAILDTCYSGTVQARGGPEVFEASRTAVQKMLDARHRGKGLVVVTASRLAAQEKDVLKHGVVNKAILECLEGKDQPANKDKPRFVVTMRDVRNHIEERVKELASGFQAAEVKASDGLDLSQIPVAVVPHTE